MDPTLARDLENIDAILATTTEEARRILSAVHTRPVAIAPGAPDRLQVPHNGSGFAGAMQAFTDRYSDGFSGSAGPRYLGFVTGGATPAALAGDWLTATFDNSPITRLDSVAADIEHETIAWLAEAFGMQGFTGAFVSGATMSNVVGLALGREWVADQAGVSVAEDGLHAIPPITILSGAPHSTVFKALSMLGMGRSSVTTVPCIDGREAVDIAALERALDTQAGRPCIVVANAGTVNTVDFDDLTTIAALRDHFPFWLHVDAAFGAFAALSPDLAPLVDGLAQADSVCVDAHKWLNVPYDSAMQFTRHRDLQVRVFHNNAAYLGAPTDDPDFVHLTPESSRRLRALPAWFTLQAYGIAGHREIVERHVRLARALGERIQDSTAFELMAEVRLNVVCFTLAADGSREAVQRFVDALRDGGRTFMTPTVLFGRPGVRAAFSNWRTGDEDVAIVWRAMCDATARA